MSGMTKLGWYTECGTRVDLGIGYDACSKGPGKPSWLDPSTRCAGPG